jgi:hypothetical protein
MNKMESRLRQIESIPALRRSVAVVKEQTELLESLQIYLNTQSSNTLECNICGSVDQHIRLCGGCKQTKYCSIKCQTQDWQQGHARTCGSSFGLLGDAADMAREVKHRQTLYFDLSGGIVGPSNVFIVQPQNYRFQLWIFGEVHTSKARDARLDALDVQLDPQSNKLVFSGAKDSGYMEIARYFYAAASKAFKQNKRMDVFIERQQSHKQALALREKGIPDIRLEQLDQLFFPCLHGDLRHCDFSPYVRFHAVDYRNVHAANLLVCMQEALLIIKSRVQLQQQVVAALMQFERDCPNWFSRWTNLVLYSSNYVQEGVDLFAAPCATLKKSLLALIPDRDQAETRARLSHFFELMNESGFAVAAKATPDGRIISRIRAQHLALAKENGPLAAHILGMLTVRELVPINWRLFPQIPDAGNRLHAILMQADGRLMDAGLLCRVFRSFGDDDANRATIKIIYVGGAHADFYCRFVKQHIPHAMLLETSANNERGVVFTDYDAYDTTKILRDLIEPVPE